VIAAARSHIPRLIRFGLVGSAATLSYVAVSVVLHRAGLAATPASMTAYLIAGCVSYVGHKRVTFRSDRAHAVAAPRFLASLGLGIVAAGAISAVLVEGLRLPVIVSTLTTCVVAPLLSYATLSLFVFGGRPGPFRLKGPGSEARGRGLAGAADRHTTRDGADVAPN
jgi:putative flippase GtrA